MVKLIPMFIRRRHIQHSNVGLYDFPFKKQRNILQKNRYHITSAFRNRIPHIRRHKQRTWPEDILHTWIDIRGRTFCMHMHNLYKFSFKNFFLLSPKWLDTHLNTLQFFLFSHFCHSSEKDHWGGSSARCENRLSGFKLFKTFLRFVDPFWLFALYGHRGFVYVSVIAPFW